MNKKHMTTIPVFTAKIHTLQLTSGYAILSEDEIRAKPYISKFYYTDKKAVYRINPNKCGMDVSDLEGLEQALECIAGDLCLEEYQITRLDIAIDTVTPYEELFKINSYIKELFAVSMREKNSYHTCGDDLIKRSLKVTNRSYELEIYNKEVESGGFHPAKTRIEFRTKRVRKNTRIRDLVEDVIRFVDALPTHMELLNQIKIAQLGARYLCEQSPDYEGRITDFSSFVGKYADFIYNRDILKGLYCKHFNKDCKYWLYQYRKRGKTLTLYNNGYLAAYLKQIKCSLKGYLKSDGFTSLSTTMRNGNEMA